MYAIQQAVRTLLFSTLLAATLAGCASAPAVKPEQAAGSKKVCDSYIILSMCVEDLVGDGTVDMIYFTDTSEVFMYQADRKPVVAGVMPFHRCAVPLNEGMQATTNRILNRKNLNLAEEMDITRQLISNYIAAKPTIDACNAGFEQSASGDTTEEDDFSLFEPDWDTP